jgi:tRNA(His) 5'-end guanylyltransferase
MKKDSIGNRMKENYEDRYRIKLTRRTPVIIRLDGKAFHNLTKGCQKPFDDSFQSCMQETSRKLLEEIQGAKCCYTQSDEISVLLTDFDNLNSESWFDYNLQKIVSISASIASVYFSNMYCKFAVFDSRAFNIPKEEACNYFIWRQQDWIRNSLQMMAQSLYSHKELHKKNTSDMHEMIFKKGLNWNNIDNKYKNGVFIYLSESSFLIKHDQIFTKNRELINQYFKPLE